MTDPTPLRILFLGTPEAAVPALRALVAAGHALPLVVTRPDRPKGRGKAMAASPVKEAALDAGLEVFQPENVNAPESVARLRAAEPDVLLIVAYGRILRRRVLEVPRLVPLNVHFSLLPEYRGASPVARAIADGKARTGVSIQHVVRALDAGPVYASRTVDVRPDEKAGALESRLAEVGAGLLVDRIGPIARGEVPPVAQDDAAATYAPMLTKEDGRVDWSRPAIELARHVRAMDPWPGATTRFRGATKELAVLVTEAAAEGGGGEPGVVSSADRSGIVVATGEGVLRILALKPAGKREMTAAEFVNGHRPVPGNRFG